jgi:ABC-type nickel/cobalt efflux system permease component RcnA
MTSALHILSGSPVDEAALLGRRIRDFTVDGGTELVKRADLPRLVEAGRDTAVAAVSDAKDRITGRRRRRTRSLASISVVAIALAVGAGAWWFIRGSGASVLRRFRADHDSDENLDITIDQAFDADAHSRATDDGMGHAGATAHSDGASETAYPLAILTA